MVTSMPARSGYFLPSLQKFGVCVCVCFFLPNLKRNKQHQRNRFPVGDVFQDAGDVSSCSTTCDSFHSNHNNSNKYSLNCSDFVVAFPITYVRAHTTIIDMSLYIPQNECVTRLWGKLINKRTLLACLGQGAKVMRCNVALRARCGKCGLLILPRGSRSQVARVKWTAPQLQMNWMLNKQRTSMWEP